MGIGPNFIIDKSLLLASRLSIIIDKCLPPWQKIKMCHTYTYIDINPRAKVKWNQGSKKRFICYKGIKIIISGPKKTCQSSTVILNRTNTVISQRLKVRMKCWSIVLVWVLLTDILGVWVSGFWSLNECWDS